MANPLFDLEAAVGRLPLWAKVLLASRAVRRAALALPEDSAAERDPVLAACDEIDGASSRAQLPRSSPGAGRRTSDWPRSG